MSKKTNDDLTAVIKLADAVYDGWATPGWRVRYKGRVAFRKLALQLFKEIKP